MSGSALRGTVDVDDAAVYSCCR
jgi:excisionase family DNA binding protein